MLVRWIEPGEMVSWYMGCTGIMSWRRAGFTLFAAVPLNWIIGLGARVWWRLQRGFGYAKWQRAIGRAIADAERCGYERGYGDGLRYAIGEVSRRFDT